MEEAKISFYKIHECGLYKHGEEKPKYGNIANFLDELLDWAKKDGKSLEETCTYAIDESEGISRAFCYDLVIDNQTGDCLLTTWNETPSYEGRVAAVKANSKFGNAEIEFTELPKDSIPGYATYFWFWPTNDVFATIRFQHVYNGKKNLDKYLQEFIAKFSSYVVLSDEGEAILIFLDILTVRAPL